MLVQALLEQVEVMDDYPPRSGTMRVSVYDIESGDKPAVPESEHGQVGMRENMNPKVIATVSPDVSFNSFDQIESWTNLYLNAFSTITRRTQPKMETRFYSP